MSFLIGELAARLTADDKPLLGKLKGARQEGASTARAIGKGFSDASMSIKEEMYFLDREIKWLEKERKKLYDPEKIKSYTRELEELTERKKELQRQGKEVENTTTRMNKAFQMGVSLIASYFSVRTVQSIVSMAAEAGKLAAEIETLNKQTGLGVQFLQEYRYVADQLGVSFEALTGAVGGLTRRIPTIQSGSGRAADAMRALGVSLYDAEGQMRSMDSLFPSIITALQQMENETERNALANSILGRRAEQLIPLLDTQAESVDQLRKRFRDSGLAMDESMIRKGAEFDAKMKELSMRTEGLRNEFGFLAMDIVENLIPAMEGLIDTGNAIVNSRLYKGFVQHWSNQIGSVSAQIKIWSLSQRQQATITEDASRAIRQNIEYLRGLRRELLDQGKPVGGLSIHIAGLESALNSVRVVQGEVASGQAGLSQAFIQSAKTVGDITREILELERSIEGMSDSGAIAEAQKQIEQLQFQLDGLLGRLRPEDAGFKVLDGLVDTLQEVSQEIASVDTSIPDVYFPPGSLGAMQQRLQELRTQLLFATDPAIIEALKGQISELLKKIQEFGPEAERSTRKADMAMGALGNSIGSVVGHLIAGKKEALSFGRVLASVVPALINVATGGQGGFAASLASGLFGGLFHGGGVVPGHGEKYIKVKGGEGVFTQSQMKAMGVMSSAAPQISPVALKSAFSAALQEHTQRLGPEEVYVMAQKGRRAS